MSEKVTKASFSDFALGRHLTAEFYDCDMLILADAARMESIFIAAAQASGAAVLSSSFHDFAPQGVSGVVVISESHFAVHAWPEHDYAAVDIFTCGDGIDFQIALTNLKRDLHAEQLIVSSIMNRGIVGNNGVERLIPTCTNGSQSYVLNWRRRFESMEAWGMLASIDVYDCRPERLSNTDAVVTLLRRLSRQLNLQVVGESQVSSFKHPQKGEGNRVCQLLDEGTVTAHLSADQRCAYLDLFSCKFFEPRTTAELVLEFFRGKHYRMQVALRQ